MGNSTLTLTAALCGPALRDTPSSVRYVYATLHRTTCQRTDFHVTRQAKESFLIVLVKMFSRWFFGNKKYLLGSERRNLER